MAGKKNGNGTAVAVREEIPVVLQRLNTVLAGEDGPSEMELLVQESDESEAIELERVKIATGGKEKFDRDDDLTDSITGIIVSAQTARGYWESEGTKGTPFCSSVDGKFGEVSADVTPDSARLVAANELANRTLTPPTRQKAIGSSSALNARSISGDQTGRAGRVKRARRLAVC